MGNNISLEEERNLTDSNHIPTELASNTQQIALHDAFLHNNQTAKIFSTTVCTKYPQTAIELLKKRDGLQCTPFHYAVCGGHVELVSFLLAKQVELGIFQSEKDVVNDAIANGVTSVHLAISSYHRDVLQLLLEKGGDVTAKTAAGATPLHTACVYGDSKTDGGSVEMYGADVNAKTNSDSTPLLTVLGVSSENENLTRGQEEIALVLLSKEGVDVSVTFQSKSLLQLASSLGMDRVTKLLLEKNCNPNDPGPDGLYPIHLAAKVESKATVEALLNGGARADALTTDKESPLMMTVNEENVELVQLFLAHGADINRVNDHGSVLCYAARSGSLEMCLFLLEKGADISLKDISGNTALHLACAQQSANPDLIKALVGAKIDVNAKNNEGSTALHCCCKYTRNGKAILALVSSGADVNAKDAQGNTGRGAVAMMKHLLDNGADVNAANTEGKTPLLLCVECGSIQGVKSLLDRKATKTQAIRDLATQKGIKEIEKLLKGAPGEK